jgi:hypothetical protein
MECNFCKKILTNLSSLNNHKATAKYCLKIQGLNQDNKFKCTFCDKNFTSKNNLLLHNKTCNDLKSDKDIIIAKQETIIEQFRKQEETYKEQLRKQEETYKEQIKELQDKLERLATTAISKPTTTNNTKITFNGILDLSHERISNIVANNLTGDHIVDGMTGIAKFVKDKIISADDGTILYNCADASRQVFKYKNNEGDILKDQKANKLIGAIQPALKEKTNDLYFYYDNEIKNYVPDEDDKKNIFTKKDKYKFLKDESLKIHDDISEMHQNNKFSTELVNLVTK